MLFLLFKYYKKMPLATIIEILGTLFRWLAVIAIMTNKIYDGVILLIFGIALRYCGEKVAFKKWKKNRIKPESEENIENNLNNKNELFRTFKNEITPKLSSNKYIVFTLLVLSALMVTSGAVAESYEKSFDYSEKYPESALVNELSRSMSPSSFPYYNSLKISDKKIYDNICIAAMNHETDVLIGKFSTYEECEKEKNILSDMLTLIIYENPEYFYIDPTEIPFEIKRSNFLIKNDYLLFFKIKYLLDKDEAEAKSKELNSAVKAVAEKAKVKSTKFDKVLYVYDYILNHARYDDSLLKESDTVEFNGVERSAYGCLINGKTICSGYAAAFALIVRELGINCGIEFGRGLEKNEVNKKNVTVEDVNHAWNYIYDKITNKYAYFDLTFDDNYENDANNHFYFGISKEELIKDHAFVDYDYMNTLRNEMKNFDDDMNYYIHNNLYFKRYSFDDVYKLIKNNKNKNQITIKFGSYDALNDAYDDLVSDKKIFNIFPNKKTCKYLLYENNGCLKFIFD